MLVWIVRHGKAEPSSRSGRDDDRRLAPRGTRQSKWLGRVISARPDRPATIVSSPIRRAIETARLINTALGGPLTTSAEIETGRAPSDALGLIREWTEDRPLMLVGHNPQLERLVGTLVEGPGAEAEVKTGQAFLLKLDPDSPLGGAEVIDVLRLDED